MTIIDIHAARSQFSRLVEEVEAGGTVTIARAGKPVARLVPYVAEPKPARRVLGRLDGQFNIPADFDAPLPDEVLDAFEGR